MHSSLERLHASYAQTLRGRSCDALEINPGNEPTRWNARQIVEHLRLTYQSSSEVFRERLAKGRPAQSKPRTYQRVQQLFVCRFGYFPTGRPAPLEVIPALIASEPLDGSALSAKFHNDLRAMNELLIACEKLFGKRRFSTHQVLGPISANQWRRFHVAHGRHHLKQLRELIHDVKNLPKESQIPPEN